MVVRLQKHMAVHGKEEDKPLACAECGKRFLTKREVASTYYPSILIFTAKT